MIDQHICCSGNPSCSGINPCAACMDQIVFGAPAPNHPPSSILTRAMAAAGGPFVDPDWAGHFIRTLVAEWRSTMAHIASLVQPTLNAKSEVESHESRETESQTPDSRLPTPDELRAAAQVEETTESLDSPDPQLPTPNPENDDPDRLGYEISPDIMAGYMTTIKNGHKTKDKEESVDSDAIVVEAAAEATEELKAQSSKLRATQELKAIGEEGAAQKEV